MNAEALHANKELELRLAVRAEAMEDLAALLFPTNGGAKTTGAKSGLRTQKLHAVYYDTADQRLRRRGLALRVRKRGSKFTQTLKSDSSSTTLFDRDEWEVEVNDFKPDLRAFKDAEIAERVGLIFPEELEPLFETVVSRKLGEFDLTTTNRTPARIEVAFDQGEVKAKDGKKTIAEVELELKAGDPDALFVLAGMMRDTAPLRLLPLDKATRGYQLALEEAPRWTKAEKVRLTPDMTVEQGLETVMRAGVDHWLQNEQAAHDGRDPEGVHQLRVALRRIRSALTLFRTVLVDETRTSWNERLKAILNAMGPARDLDVFDEEVLAPVLEARPEDDSLLTLREVVRDRRTQAQAAVREAIESQAYADAVLDFLAWLDRKGWREGADVDLLIAQRMPLAELASGTLDKGHKRVRKRGKHFETIDAEARHQVRIALKKLRYGTEFFANLFENKHTKDYLAAASKMQDRLGLLNDVAVAEATVDMLVKSAKAGEQRVKAARGGGIVIGWYAHLLALGEADTVADWHTFTKRDPFWRPAKSAGKDVKRDGKDAA